MNIQCMQCGAMKDLPPGADPHDYTWCTCCTITGDDGKPHHHGQAAASCPGNGGVGHPGEPCPHPNPKICIRVSRPVLSGDKDADRVVIPGGPVRPVGEPCPGGHCGVGVKNCTVCRPVMHLPQAGMHLAGPAPVPVT
jgi:hypothetical protein